MRCFADEDDAAALPRRGQQKALEWPQHDARLRAQAFADVAQHLKSLTEVKDLQAWTEAQARAGQPVAERLASYTRGVYAVISEANKNFAKSIEAQVTEFNKTCATALDQVAKNTPAGAETTIAFAKSALAASNQAYDALSKATRQITEVADSAVETSAKKKAA